MEREDIVVARNKYLRIIEQNRNCDRTTRRAEVYLDETRVNQNECVDKCWTDPGGTVGPKTKTGRGARFIVLYAGGAQGFIPGALLMFRSQHGNKGDYHDSMDHAKFKTWFEEQLLPNISANSLIIMDNAPYHSKINNKVPTTANRKCDIIGWLSYHNIAHDPSMTKPELLQIAKCHKDKQTYVIDELARAHGHDVLRLPPYYCQFNPIELIWAQIKNDVRKCNSNCDQSMKTVEKLARLAVSKVTDKDWRKCIEHTMRVEDEYRRKDIAREYVYESFIINIDSESSDDSGDNTDFII